jgi:alanyl-tRNA synthetase
VRRIEALTGAAAEAHLAEEEALLREAAAALRTTPSELPARIVSLVDERRRLEHDLAEVRRALASAGPATKAGAKRVGEIAFDGRIVDDIPGRELKALADDLKQRIGSGIVAVVSRADGKAAIVVGVTDDLTDRFNAVDLVRSGAAALGGKGGGGRPDMAQAGGPGAAQAAAALVAVENAIAAKSRVPISAPAAE